MNPVRRASDALVLLAVTAIISLALVAVPESADAVTNCVGTTTVTCTYSTAGAHTFTVPAGITSVTIVANGAGGAGGSSIASGAGGSGTKVTATRTVTGGQNLALVVGGGGGVGGGAGGGGGGASTVDVSVTAARIVAGGGGGGGARSGGGVGGSGGAACGGAGGSGEDAVTGGGGGGCAGIGSAGAGGAGEDFGAAVLDGAAGNSTTGGAGGGDSTNSAGGFNGGGRGGYGGLYGVSPWSASGGGGGGGGIGGGGGGGGATGSSGYGVSGGGAGGGGAGGSTGPSGATYASAGNGVSGGYPGSSGSITITYTKLTQSITFSALGAKTFGDGDFTVSATATSGLTVTFSSSTETVCTVSGTTVTIEGAGTCTILADQAGSDGYAPAVQVSRSFTVATADQTITFDALGDKTYGDADFAVSATATSGLTVEFASSTNPVCTVSGDTVTIQATGLCTIDADQSGDDDWNAATTVTRSFTVAKADQTIDFGPLDGQVFGVEPFGVSASASSGLDVDFSSTTTVVCTVSGTTLTVHHAGTCTIAADQSGDSLWNPAPQVTAGFTVAKADQTIDILELDEVPTFGDLPFLIAGLAESGLDITYSTLTPEVCTVAGSTVTIVTGGWCTIAFDQAGDDDWNAAPQVTSSFPILQAGQKISFPALSDVVFGDDPVDVSAFASSGLRVGFASVTPEVCAVEGRTVTAITPGTCSIRASQPGDIDYLAAPSVTRGFTVVQTPQTITFDAIDDMTFGDEGFAVVATASSGLPVSFSSLTPAVCTVAGATTTIVAAGDCTIEAGQAGDLFFAAAPSVPIGLTVARAGVEITIGVIDDATVGDDAFAVEATASSGLPVTLSSGAPDVCTVDGSTVTVVAEGTCTIVADHAGDANHAAAQATADFDVVAAPDGVGSAPGGADDGSEGGGAGTIIIVLLAAAAAVGGGVFFVRRRA